MLTLKKTTDENLIKSIYLDKTLFAYTNEPGTEDKFKLPEGFEFLAIYKDDALAGIFTIKQLTQMVTEAHIRILTKYSKNDFPVDCIQILKSWVRSYSISRKIISYVPANCHHVIKFMKEIGARLCGQITEGIIYNDVLVSLLTYELDIRRGV